MLFRKLLSGREKKVRAKTSFILFAKNSIKLLQIFYNVFFKVGNNAIRIANYYECLIVPSDIETKKKIIRGFDYLDIGAINLYNGDKIVGCIGMKSDLVSFI